ncbi:MAG TPA: (Fe-S)-binding protein [Candidatus Coprenecus pullistercoris]|nr:(Fe-S)-binding protein [Candidatus Coprenecus pullistercoris]
MKDRFISGYNDFVLPFMIGMCFILTYLAIGIIRVIVQLPAKDRKKFFLSLINPKLWLKNLKDIICDVLLHTKIWKRKPLLGYMHSSIAFGWFMLIVLGHIETWLFVPDRLSTFYYPVFFRFFVMETDHTIGGSFFFFLMDFFLLVVLSGVFLAMFKRIRSMVFGMRRTTKNQLPDRLAMYCLWAIFPVRLLAESFTAGIAGGSFLTRPMYWLFSNFLSDTYHILPTWWAYSTLLGTFFVLLPFTRYMHIPTEAFLIILRNAGIKVSHHRNGYTTAQIYSCSNCGMCIDACPMMSQKKNLRYATVYFNRLLRRRNWTKCEISADKCLMCGKCVAVCPVNVDSCSIKQRVRAARAVPSKADYTYFETYTAPEPAPEKVLYYAGCMTQLTPVISKAVGAVLDKAGIGYTFLDSDGGICCGRPLILAGRNEQAQEMIRKNTELIRHSGATTLLLSCPICYKVFRENYDLNGIRVVHYTEYFDELLRLGRITIRNSGERIVYHDPCELGRGCGVYRQPRHVLSAAGNLVEAAKSHDESICCGGSLGSLTLSYEDRKDITLHSLDNLMYASPERIVTACPLCLKTFSPYAPKKVSDFAEIVAQNMN